MRAFGFVMLVMLVGACGDDGTGPMDQSVPCRGRAECDDGIFCNGVELCLDSRCLAGLVPCDSCDEENNTCPGGCADRDADGVRDSACGGIDCNDSDPSVFPGTAEVCDDEGVDEDCNPATYGFRDEDMDGVVDARCCNGATCGPDCDDTRADVGGPLERCDGVDNDCDGAVDESVGGTFYPDADGDGYGDSTAAPRVGCLPDEGFVAEGGDCDDGDDTVRPGAFDRCDPAAIDDDCDGTPNNPPGGCDCSDGTYDCPEQQGACTGSTYVCQSGVPRACSYLPTVESCNGLDDDCDGATDEGLSGQVYFADADGDGFGDPATAVEACRAPAGTWVGRAGDCDDSDADAYPGQARWFTTPRRGGGFDYDCSGGEEQRYPEGSCTCGAAMSCEGSMGYLDESGAGSGCGAEALRLDDCRRPGPSGRCSSDAPCRAFGQRGQRECH